MSTLSNGSHGGQAIQFPRWVFRWGMGLAVCLSLVLLYLHSRRPPNPDDAVYDYIGWVIAEGGTIYVEATDQNWPGMMLIHAVSAKVFGNSLYAYRTLDTIHLGIAAGFLGWFGRGLVGRSALPWCLVLYPLVYTCLSAWNIGQRDIVAAPFLLAAGWLQWVRTNSGKVVGLWPELRRLADQPAWSLALLQGGILGWVTLIRPTLLIEFGLLALIQLYHQRRTPLAVVGQQAVVFSAIVGVLGAAAVLGMSSGATAQWWEDSIAYNLEVYGTHGAHNLGRLQLLGALTNVPKFWHFLIASAVAGSVMLWRRHHELVLLVLTLPLAAIISFLVQGKGFAYHLGAIYAALVLLCLPVFNWGVHTLAFGNWRMRSLAAVLTLGVLAVFASKAWRVHGPVLLGATRHEVEVKTSAGEEGVTLGDFTQLAQYIRKTVPPGETILFWGRPMSLNYISERRSPTRYSSFAMLDEPRARFSRFQQWKADLQQRLTKPGPALICLVKDDDGFRYMPKPGGEPRLSDVLYRVIAERYRPAHEVGAVTCFNRREQS